MKVLNTSEFNETWVRIKIFIIPRATYTVTGLEQSNGWKQNLSDEYYYYTSILPSTEGTTIFTVTPNQDDLHDTVKAIIVAECTPVIYDDEGNPTVDWTTTYNIQ